MNGLYNFKRYARQIILPEVGIDGQNKLQNANILIIGAGGLGCPLLLYLTGAGVGKIGVVDHDVVDETNLHRQILYHVSDIGKSKADTAVVKLRLLNPDIQLTSYSFKLTDANAAELISEYDLVIDGSDNFPTRYLVNDSCVALNKPLVFGSIFTYEGQVSVFNFNGGPDYRILYPEPPPKDEVPNCAESGVLGTLPGIIGSMMANEAIKVICGFGDVLSGQLLIFNALNNDTTVFRFGFSTVRETLLKEANLEDGHLSSTSAYKADEKELPDKNVQHALLKEIGTRELKIWESNHIPHQLIDVREVYEFEENNAGGVNIPLYEINKHINELLHHPKIVLCCATGARSRIAANLLKDQFQGELFSLVISISS